VYIDNFLTNHPVKKILKVGPHLPKLLSNIKQLTFLEHGVVKILINDDDVDNDSGDYRSDVKKKRSQV